MDRIAIKLYRYNFLDIVYNILIINEYYSISNLKRIFPMFTLIDNHSLISVFNKEPIILNKNQE